MKTLPFSLNRPLTLASLLLLAAADLPTAAYAKPDKHGKSSQHEKKSGKGQDSQDHDHGRDERVRHYHSIRVSESPTVFDCDSEI